MRPDEFDRALMDEMGQLPPPPDAAALVTPWQTAIKKILWGMVLTTFKLEFFYLQYILPLLGACLLYLGYRSLRRENNWFRLCHIISGFQLIWHMTCDVLAATPVMELWGQSPYALHAGLAVNCVDIFLLFMLRGGVRAAFAKTGESKPRDWLVWGIAAHVATLAIAIWCDLVPLTEPTLFGMSISKEWYFLYHARVLAAIAMQIFLLVCIAKQSGALAGRGYDIIPVPVRLPAGAVIGTVFALVLLALPPAMYLGGHIDNGPTEPAAVTLTQEAAVIRERLVVLGLPEELAACLDGEELSRCAGATAVHEPVVLQSYNYGDKDYGRAEGNPLTVALTGLEAEQSVWMVELPEGQVRYYCWFRYTTLPALRLQEQFTADPIGNYPTEDYAARIFWTEEGRTLAAVPELHLSGGQTADQLNEEARDWFQHELDRLGGRLHYTPWFAFSIPKKAESFQGYLAYSADASVYTSGEHDSFYDSVQCYLRHQHRWLQYPFHSVLVQGGTSSVGDYGPIQSVNTLAIFENF